MWVDYEVLFIFWYLILGFNGVIVLYGLRLNFGYFMVEVIFFLVEMNIFMVIFF